MNNFLKSILLAASLFSIQRINAQDLNLLRASFLIQEQRNEDAVQLLEFGGISSDTSNYFRILGKACVNSDRLDQAKKCFTHLINKTPDSEAFYQLARISFMEGNLKDGLEYLKQHLKYSDRHSFIEIQQDQAFAGYEQDRQWIRFWSEERFTSKEDLFAEARVQALNPDSDEAFFKQLIISYPQEALGYTLSGIHYQQTGLEKEADNCFLKGFELDPNSLFNLNSGARFYQTIDKANKAVEWFEKSLQLNPYQPDIWMLRLHARLQAGDQQGAQDEMQFLENLGVESTELLGLLANELKKTDRDAAIDLYNRALSQNPLNYKGLNKRAELLLEDKFFEQALEDWSMSLDINPIQPEVYYQRAALRFDQGDQTGACLDWQKALRYGHRKALDAIYKNCKTN